MQATSNNMLTVKQAAEYLGIKPGTLNVWRCTKAVGVPYVQVGKCVRYKVQDLDDFIARRRVAPVEME